MKILVPGARFRFRNEDGCLQTRLPRAFELLSSSWLSGYRFVTTTVPALAMSRSLLKFGAAT